MRALRWDGHTLRFTSAYPTPHVTAEMALLRVRLAGICSTDLQILHGYMGFRGIPGHEFVGEVCAGPADWLGKRVVGEINFACASCTVCQQGLERHCPYRRVMGIVGADGSFAEYVAVPVRNLHLVPEAVTDEEAVFTEPLAAAFAILEQVHLQPDAAVVVLGDGKLGLLCAQVLHHTGARVTVVGKHAHKLRIAHQCGLRTILLSDWRPQPQADVVVEATGTTAGLQLAIAAVRPRGTLILKSTIAQEHTLSLASLVVHEVTVIGSRCGRFPPALRALECKGVAVTPLIAAVYPLTEGVEAVNHAARPGVLKVLLQNR